MKGKIIFTTHINKKNCVLYFLYLIDTICYYLHVIIISEVATIINFPQNCSVVKVKIYAQNKIPCCWYDTTATTTYTKW